MLNKQFKTIVVASIIQGKVQKKCIVLSVYGWNWRAKGCKREIGAHTVLCAFDKGKLLTASFPVKALDGGGGHY